MYKFENIQRVHLEPTQRCQALCPMCDRTNNPHIENLELTIEQFKHIFYQDFVLQLKNLLMCGNHGDPIICRDTLLMFEYLRETNPNIYLQMTTNAGARNYKWWKELAKIIGKHGKVTFSVDGLEDTNHLYRVNVNWEKIEESMDAYTQAGGQGEWVYLIFEHNQHQVEEAERLAKLFGLTFVKKKSGRWVQTKNFEKVDKKITKKGNIIKPPTLEKYKNKSVETFEQLLSQHGSFNNYLDNTPIKCKTLEKNEIYISAAGLVTPCCWTAGRLYKTYEKIGEAQIWNFIEDIDKINALKYPIPQIIKGSFFNNIQNSWSLPSCATGKLDVCAQKCGQQFDSFGDQWK